MDGIDHPGPGTGASPSESDSHGCATKAEATCRNLIKRENLSENIPLERNIR